MNIIRKGEIRDYHLSDGGDLTLNGERYERTATSTVQVTNANYFLAIAALVGGSLEIASLSGIYSLMEPSAFRDLLMILLFIGVVCALFFFVLLMRSPLYAVGLMYQGRQHTFTLKNRTWAVELKRWASSQSDD